MGKACPLTSSNWASASQLDGKTGSRAARRWEKRESGKARPLWASKSGLSEFEVAEWKVGCGWRDLIVYLWKGLSQLFCVWSEGRGTGTHFINHANAYRLTSSRSCFSSKSPSQIVAIICLTCWKSKRRAVWVRKCALHDQARPHTKTQSPSRSPNHSSESLGLRLLTTSVPACIFQRPPLILWCFNSGPARKITGL